MAAKFKMGDVVKHRVFGDKIVVLKYIDITTQDGVEKYVARTSDLREVTVFEWELEPVKDEEKNEYLAEDRLTGGT